MWKIFKSLYREYSIVILSFFIVSMPDIKAQTNIYSNGDVELIFQDQYFTIEFPGISNLCCTDLWNLPICRDSINLRPLKFCLKNYQCINFSLSKNIKFASEVTDTLHSSVMNKLPYNLTLPNIDFHYTPRPTTLQGLGILLMGISRAVLFPTAPDHKVDAYDFETLP